MLRTNFVTLLQVENVIEFRKQFGFWLQTEREKTGITQEQVAKNTGLNVKSISRIERGESGTKRATIELIVNSINKLSHGYKINKIFALNKAGFSTEEKAITFFDDEFAALFYDSANWSDENREDALENAKAIFKRYQEKERKKNEGN